MLAIDLLKAYGLKPKPGAWYFTLSDEPGWITVHPHGEGTKGQPVLLEKRTGEILGGLGGKFNGKHISALPQQGRNEEHGAQALITWYNKTQKGKTGGGNTTQVAPRQSTNNTSHALATHAKLSAAVTALESKGIKIDTLKFSNMPLDVQLYHVQRAGDLLNKYPKLAAFINNKKLTITADVLKSTTNGLCKGFTITLNHKNVGDEDKYVKETRRLIDKGWYTDSSDDYLKTRTLTHEFGHAVHNALISDILSNRVDELLSFVNKNLNKSKFRYFNINPLPVVQDFYDYKLKEFQTEIIKIAQTKVKRTSQKTIMNQFMSEYGRSKPAEFFAESFANLHCGRPNVLGEAMGDFLTKEFAKWK